MAFEELLSDVIGWENAYLMDIHLYYLSCNFDAVAVAPDSSLSPFKTLVVRSSS